MLRTDKPIYKVILVFNLLLIAAAVVLSAVALSTSKITVTRILTTVSELITLVFAGFYIISGYRKNAAKYYKLFGILYMMTIISIIIACVIRSISATDIVCYVLLVIGIFILTFVKNLGKTRSLAICAIIVLIQIPFIILDFIEGDPTIVKINVFICIDLACLYGIMTYAKYLDKAERGTK